MARARRGALEDAKPDRWTAFVVTAHLRLRLDIYYRRILQDLAMPDIKRAPIPRPVELAGMRSRLIRAQNTELALADTGKRYDQVLDRIDEAHGVVKTHVRDLESYEGDLDRTISRMTGGSNGGDPLDASDGQGSDGGKKPSADAKTETVKTEAATPPAKPLAEPQGEAPAGGDAQAVTTADVAPAPPAVAADLAEPAASWKGQ